MEQRKGYTYPTPGIKFCAAIGNTVPPTDDPIAVIPSASPLRFENQCDTTPSAGPNNIPLASYLKRAGVSRRTHRAHGIKTHPDAQSLRQEKLPINFALCNEEGAHY